ncbi:four-carbon acid sugar kinase family protein [Streptococcus massiliensis]|uniref:Uncharacterized protein conserved in bacteria n=1 Tax=Streptococcus massiliensis TaxID=313439 RepID=A0A380KZT7_9STRE|nr:four-carbon acid sugar kinase family protein [Streptococcus massiliensis]SUN76040.1 Uncharacterized protein conserved in bacteria [Streptococcus massiliensis]
MIKLLVVADDFTGALDTGVQFSNLGVETLVTTNKDFNFKKLNPNLEVLVIDSESRYLSFEESYQAIARIMKAAKENEIPYIYKKVDSALRGNVSSEIKAMVDDFSEQTISFIPAFPEINRVVKGGHLYINNQLVSASVFANDPYEPVTESDIRRRLQSEAQLDSTLVTDVNTFEKKAGLFLFDSETDHDLLKILETLQTQNALRLMIGCAGFAKVLAGALFLNKKAERIAIERPLLVVCGSVNPITRKQVKCAQERGFKRYSLSAKQLLNDGYWDTVEGKREIESYSSDILKHELVIFETLSKKTIEEVEKYSEDEGDSGLVTRFKIGQSLGNLTKSLLSQGVEKTFLFTGGDTLYQSMKVLGIDEVKPLSEIKPGVVLSEIKWKGKTVQVITKSGGFGEEDLFYHLHKLVKKGGKYAG